MGIGIPELMLLLGAAVAILMIIQLFRGDSGADRKVQRALKAMDALDASMAGDEAYAESMRVLHANAEAAFPHAAFRLANRDGASRRRYFEIVRRGGDRAHGLLAEMAADVTDPLAAEAWAAVTGGTPDDYARGLAGGDGGCTETAEGEGELWEGWWRYPGGMGGNRRMSMRLVMSDGVLRGRGIDEVGEFTVEGFVSEKDVAFVKRYSSHSVKYDGEMVAGEMVGWWTIRETWSGEFRLRPVKG